MNKLINYYIKKIKTVFSVIVLLTVIFLLSGCKEEPANFNEINIKKDTTYSFVAKNKIWSTGYLGIDYLALPLPYYYPSYSDYIKIGDDTTINGRLWSKILESKDEKHENWKFRYCYIMENDKKVFLKWITGGDEILMYDFSKKAGDTIKLKSIYSYNSSEDSFIVDSVKVLPVLNNIQRRHFFLHAQITQGWRFIWIEGFGSIQGFFENTGTYRDFGGINRLICVEENNLVTYKDSIKFGFNKCFFPDTGK